MTTQTKTAESSSSPPSIAIPDRRRNSIGEHLHSPNETWRPSATRRQSWDREALKREVYVKQMGPGGGKGDGMGFTEIDEEK
ncbi:hypothetical protein HYALB_00004566 [Hymenoscyphus albidus]|uniref:Uncharacterized protein n=1 Tax=Hymenoscyphus albidus TaxID=595503 RepID=A0A9N9LY34_9HELO|nr:hypothetical protein HYALB_00004566 [Hymenoscyphus albidus]